ncbi:ferredoxin [Parasporobacterium paucivorans]|uniref:Ferredoxin n=1 Tax=Parasporobacterium paucivorans DSM 15970 TaxID=1122934 RepID=A0A1M6DLA3_9FIRM|nr:ferredoxin [Parasporobacterium paucivorans]SHI74107.1 ferredoxin [Parasporobacterium paucivorans DSM 15970]
MKASVNKDECISCGLCTETCPEVFQIGADGKSEVFVEEIPAELESAVLSARDDCPVSAITVE